MVLKDNTIYLAGAINVSNEKDKDGNTIFKYDAGIVLYNIKGKYLGKYSLGEEVHHHFNSIVLDNDNLLLTGLLDIDNGKKEKQDSFIIQFNIKDNKFTEKKVLSDKNDYIVNKIVQLDKEYLVGTNKNRCGLYGCEYEPLITSYE